MRVFHFPDRTSLEARLASTLEEKGIRLPDSPSIRRRKNVFKGSFPSEIVSCTLKDGDERSFLLKYDASVSHRGHGFWGDVAYEARVYAELLRKLPLPLPAFYGYNRFSPNGPRCMVLEYISPGRRLEHSPREVLITAAVWIGRFQALCERRRSRLPRTLFKTYDRQYYLGWLRRTSRYAAQFPRGYSWLPELRDRFIEKLDALTRSPLTIVHGEFYPKNILVSGRDIYPVDWQSAAIGRGEIDLASLTENWKPASLVRECEERYARARWPEGPPEDFAEALALARIYWPLRWLGDRSSLTRKRRQYFSCLRVQAEKAGLL